MAKPITAAEKIARARILIQKARDLPVPAGMGKSEPAYIADVKELLKEARDLVKFIPYTPTATAEIKKDVEKIFAKADQANRDLLH